MAAMRAGLIQWGLLVVGMGAFISGMAIGGHNHLTDAWCALGAGAIVAALVLLERSRRLWVPEPSVRLGGASYAIYLVQCSAVSVLACVLTYAFVGPVPATMYGPAVTFGALVGIAFDRAFDRPTQRFLRERPKPVLLEANAKPLSGCGVAKRWVGR